MSERPLSPAAERARTGPAELTSAARQRFAAEIVRCEARSARLSLLRLLSFLACGVSIAAAITQSLPLAWALAASFGLGFVALVVQQARVHTALGLATIRRDVHDRNLARIEGRFGELPSRGERLFDSRHVYAADLDLWGPGSLFQRIDVTHTVQGARCLADWLSRAAEPAVIRERQSAVRELAEMVELRQELEAAALRASGGDRLDGRPFRELSELPSYFAQKPWLAPTIFVLPLALLALYLLGKVGVLPAPSWLLLLLVQIVLLWVTARPVRRAFDLAAARQGAVEAFEHMLRVAEAAPFQSSLLRALQERLRIDGEKPSVHMRSLRSWTSSAELRQQFLFYILVTPLTLWDLHVLRGLEAWNRRVGKRTPDWFAALGELEALCSLGTLAFIEPDATFPEVAERGALEATGLAHPLLPVATRVANDVSLDGPRHALIVTGSNMAGKSTLLRALGLNVVVALAGGPVCAARMRVPQLRVRASMRIEDSLRQGASYFHAELQRLRSVVEDAAAEPPVLFLLDELLRGTNARARHVGGRAVVLHLLERGALGLVATHDIALSELEREHPDRVKNVHFTDVVERGEMRFDYKLRPGVVRTSNALRLLSMAGIDVPASEAAGAEVLELVADRPRENV